MKKFLLAFALVATSVCALAQPTAYYYRPQGAVYSSYYTTEGSPSVTGWIAPYLWVDRYETVKFTNASTGATAYNWTYWAQNPATFSIVEKTATTTDIEFTMLENSCKAPSLTATDDAGAEATYQLAGVSSKSVKSISNLTSSPSYPGKEYIGYDNRHVWSSSKFFAASSNRDGSKTSGTYTYSLGTGKGALFGKNNQGYIGLGTAFEAPQKPYIVHAAGVRFTNMVMAGDDATAEFKVTIYALDAIPAYVDDVPTSVAPGRVIATATVNVNNALLSDATKFSTTSAGKYTGMMVFNFADPVTIDCPILVAFTGYDSDAVTEFTSYSSIDYFDEGQGELGYILKVNGEEQTWTGMNNIITALKDRKAAPSVFLEMERPFLNYLYTTETGYIEMPSEGGDTISSIYASRGQEYMIVSCPDWITASLEDVTYGEPDYQNETELTLSVDPYPATGSELSLNEDEPAPVYREGDVVVTLQGVRTLTYHIKQQQEKPTGIDDINAGAEVKSVKYVNALGQVADAPFEGINMVVTTYSNGKTSTAKVVK